MTEERIALQPGAFAVTRTPAVITTILGSSTAVCLWSRDVAGVTHFVLPWGGADRSPRFGNHALPMLLEAMIVRGARKAELFASLFGGSGDVLGRQNLAEAREFLTRHAIPVVREDAGHDRARKLTFHTADGSSVVRKI